MINLLRNNKKKTMTLAGVLVASVALPNFALAEMHKKDGAHDKNKQEQSTQYDKSDYQLNQNTSASAGSIPECERGFTQIDQNKDNKVSPEEASFNISQAYDLIDNDGDDQITQTEWQACDMTYQFNQAYDFGVDEANLEQSFDEIDSDKSGNLSRQEVSDYTYNQYQSSSEKNNMPEDEAGTRANSFFQTADQNDDDEITREEFVSMSDQTSLANDNNFEQLDNNNDSSISRAEWQEHHQAAYNQASEMSENEDQPDVWSYYIYSY
jgi:Ca2+-binding EF-hand superfamily protein